MRCLLVSLCGVFFVSLVPTGLPAQTICWDDTINVRIETGFLAGNNARLRWEVISSAPNSPTSDYVRIRPYDSDLSRWDHDTSYGGPIKANMFGPYSGIPSYAEIHSQNAFYNAHIVTVDSLGTYFDFAFALVNYTDTAEHPTEFSFYWNHFPDGVPEHAVPGFNTTDPFNANALFTVSAWNDSCELVVFSPAVFIAPDSIYLPDSLGVIGINDEQAILTQLKILGAYPNPSTTRITIAYSTPAPGPVDLYVFDIQGRRVFQMTRRHESAGEWVMTWPGTDAAGRRVASGVYFVQLRNERKAIIRKVVMVK